ncbi:MAG: hypothetical protein MUF61_03215 [archaeon]|nr:hypothetical protein [archaeon]
MDWEGAINSNVTAAGYCIGNETTKSCIQEWPTGGGDGDGDGGTPLTTSINSFTADTTGKNCDSGCTVTETCTGTWDFCAITDEYLKVIDNVDDRRDDVWRCRTYRDSGQWKVSAYYNRDGGGESDGYAKCTATCIKHSGGSGSSGVSKLIAGSGITISPTTGLGDVTIGLSGGGSGTVSLTGCHWIGLVRCNACTKVWECPAGEIATGVEQKSSGETHLDSVGVKCCKLTIS